MIMRRGRGSFTTTCEGETPLEALVELAAALRRSDNTCWLCKAESRIDRPILGHHEPYCPVTRMRVALTLEIRRPKDPPDRRKRK